jgi:hypothetical protein
VETLPPDTTVTINDDRKTVKTAAKCKAFGKACRICNKVHHMTTVCVERPTNIVVGTTDEDITEEEDPSNRACDDQDQKSNLPIHETTDIVNTACHRQWDEDDACLTQTAVEKHSLVGDYMGEEGDKESLGSLKTYEIESSKRRETQPTHHKESSVFDKTYQGDVPKLFDKTYKANMIKVDVKDVDKTYKGDMSKLFDEAYMKNVFELAVTDNAEDVNVPGAVATDSSNKYGPEDLNTNYVEGMTGTESRGSGPRTTPRGST